MAFLEDVFPQARAEGITLSAADIEYLFDNQYFTQSLRHGGRRDRDDPIYMGDIQASGV